MRRLSKQNRSFFQKCGRLGAKKRNRKLSPERRSAIASAAAQARWETSGRSPNTMPSVRFNAPRLEDPAYLEEILLEGSLDDWRQIYRKIADHPFGPLSRSLERVLTVTSAYGVIPLWRGILRTVQGNLT